MTFFHNNLLKSNWLALGLLITLLPGGNADAAAQSGDPWQVVNTNAERVMDALDELRDMQPSDGVVTDAMVDRLVTVLTPIVDFDTIARTVMGRHVNQASEAQIGSFTEVFRTTIVRLYLQSFLNFGIAEVNVQNAPADFDPTSDRASVRMQAVDDDGNQYQLRYSMRRNDEGPWRVQNIMVEGVNLGLTYLNQFDSAMQRQGSVEQVIVNWRNEMESVEASGDR